MINMEEFETKNLKIRKFKLEDAEDAYKNLGTEKELFECLGYNMHKTVRQTERMISSFIYENEKMNELIWAIEDKQKREVIGYINASERSEANRICKFKCGIALNLAQSGLLEEALKVVINYLLNTGKFDVIACEFFDGCKKIVEAKSKILENVGMVKEAVLHKRIINNKTGLAENKIIYSIVQ